MRFLSIPVLLLFATVANAELPSLIWTGSRR
jgi:hypothetical protein